MNKKYLYFVLAAVFAVHFAAASLVAYRNHDFFLLNDGTEYYELGCNLGERGEFVIDGRRYYEPPRPEPYPEAYRVQLLSVFHGGLIALGLPPQIAGALILTFFTTGGSLLIWLLAARFSNGSALAAYLAMGLFQLHPMLAQYTVQFSTENAFSACLLLYLYCVTAGKMSAGSIMLAACAGAFAVLIRPTAALLLPAGTLFFFLVPFFRGGDNGRFRVCMTGVKQSVLYALVFAALLLPSAVRDHYYFGSFSPGGHLGGFNFYIGSHHLNLAAYESANGHDFVAFQDTAWAEALAMIDSMNCGPAECDKRLRDAGLDELEKLGAAGTLKLAGFKAWHFLRPYPLPDVHGAWKFRGITLIDSCLWICALLGIGIMLGRRQRFLPAAALLIPACGLAAHTATQVMMRYRVPYLIPVLILFAAVFLDWLYCRLRYRYSRQFQRMLQQKTGDDSVQ